MTNSRLTVSRRALVAGMATAATGGVASLAFAQSFPLKPIELVVLFPAGSSADVAARALADQMGKRLGQPIVVANKPGGGGSIGYKYVQQRPADGYTLVFNSTSISTVYHSGLTPFDFRAFDSIARVTVENPVIAVKADAPWKDLKSMMADVRKRPGALSVGNSGIGSHTHISAVAFFNEQKAEVLHVPFGAAQVVTSLLGGQIDAIVQVPGALTPHVRAGTLRILSALSSTREPAFPNVPTTSELGMPFAGEMWRGVASPRGTPPAVVSRLERALKDSVESPEFKAQGERMGFIPAFLPSNEFAPLVAKDDVMLARLMTKVGLKLQ
jgi:tripartite-type tricarboxylate transporter receptor subunit TctC